MSPDVGVLHVCQVSVTRSPDPHALVVIRHPVPTQAPAPQILVWDGWLVDAWELAIAGAPHDECRCVVLGLGIENIPVGSGGALGHCSDRELTCTIDAPPTKIV